MFVYLIKCVNYYKIGISKNPNTRRNTIQTHNPLDVKVCATLKADNAREIEQELHNLFLDKRSRGEWFELKHDDLTKLKVDYGFTFKLKLSKIFDNGDYDNSNYNIATKTIRETNLQLIDLVQYFEYLFECKIIRKDSIKRCLKKYGHSITKSTIDVLYEKDFTAKHSLKSLFNSCKSTWLKQENPKEYFVHRLKGMFWGRYRYSVSAKNIDGFIDVFNSFDTGFDIEQYLSKVQKMSYSLDDGEMLDYIFNYE